jgi:hypothetical protein
MSLMERLIGFSASQAYEALNLVNVKIWKGFHDYAVFNKRFRVLGKALAKVHVNGWFFGKV